MLSEVKIEATAKLNLTLEALGAPVDGYHPIASIMQSIDLADTLVLTPAERLSVSCEGLHLAEADNLAYKAAKLLLNNIPRLQPAHIDIKKRIAAAAGLGGGSSDAAAAINGLLYLNETSIGTQKKEQIARQIGSDVTFSLEPGTAMATGRGEIVERLPAPHRPYFGVLILPTEQIPDKTARMYTTLIADDYTTGTQTQNVALNLKQNGLIDTRYLYNVFTKRIFELMPNWNKTCLRAERIIDNTFHLSGAGPALFAIGTSSQQAQEWLQKLRDERIEATLFQTTN